MWPCHERREIFAHSQTFGAETNERTTPLQRSNTVVALLWMIAFAVATFVTSLPQFSSTVPSTELRLISVPMALLTVALMLRPKSEAPWYALIYAAASLSVEIGSPDIDFAVARVSIEIAQTLVLTRMLFRHFYRRFDEPLALGGWALAVLALTAVGAFLMIFAASLFPMSSADYARELVA